MSTFGGVHLTNKGFNLQTKALTGKVLKFTRLGLGEGEIGNQSPKDLNKLIKQVLSLNLTKLRRIGNDQVTTGSIFRNTDLTTGFYWREIGLFAEDPDTKEEVLYSYGFARGGNAEYIPPADGADVIEKQVDIVAIIGNASNVTAEINQSLVYETPDGANEKIQIHNELTTGIHGATSEPTAERILIRDAAGRAKVAPPSADNDIALLSTVKTHINNLIDGSPDNLNTLKELAKAIANDPNFHQTMQTALDSKETPVGSKSKADAAKQAAIDWAKSFGLGSVMKLTDDWNLISESGFYAGGNNSPVAGSTYYGIHLERTNTHAIQIVSRVGKTYTRSKENGTWQDWVLLETSIGAQAKADAAEKAAKDASTPKSHIGSRGNAHTPATTTEDGFMSKEDKSKLNGIATGAEVNQNAFQTIRGGETDIVAKSKTDNLNLLAGKGVNITGNNSQNNVTISVDNSIETITGAESKVKEHADKKDNPHGVTKSQVELGNVPNYGAATQAEAEAGAKNDKLMTPQRTKQAIEKFAQTPPITANTGGTKIAPTSPNDDILVELPKLGNGLHTFYCHQDVKNSPGVTVRGFYHQTSIGFGWVYAHSFDNRIFVNYVNDNVWRGWRGLSSVDDLLREVSKTQMSKITADNGNAYVRYNNVNLLDELVKTTTPNFMTFYASGNDVTGLPTPHSVRGTKVFSENTYGYVIVVNYYNEMFVNYYAGTYWTGWTKIGGGSVYVEATTHVNRNLTTGANNKLTYNNELIDNRGCYNPSLSRFTAPYDGLYFVEISAYFYAATSYQNFELKIWRNGEDYLNIDAKRWKPHQADTTVAFEQIASGCSIVPLKAGDYIEAYVYVGNTSFNGFRFDHSTFRFNHFRIIELGGQYYG